jgi:hypothetical protein
MPQAGKQDGATEPLKRGAENTCWIQKPRKKGDGQRPKHEEEQKVEPLTARKWVAEHTKENIEKTDQQQEGREITTLGDTTTFKTEEERGWTMSKCEEEQKVEPQTARQWGAEHTKENMEKIARNVTSEQKWAGRCHKQGWNH